MLVAAMREVAPEFEHILIGPDPHAIPDAPSSGAILHVDHQQGVHGQWRPEHIKRLQESGWKVVVTQHDTYETWEIMASRGFLDARGANALVVHEPVEGLTDPAWQYVASDPNYADQAELLNKVIPIPKVRSNVHFIRQGVLDLGGLAPLRTRDGKLDAARQPVVGSAGFPFPWKGYESLCRASQAAGWGMLLIAPGATVGECESWQRLNPEAEIIPTWLPKEEVVARLSECQATAWLYTSGNSGTSGAIRLGIAARRPLIAYRNRQFRDLEKERLLWANDEEGVYWYLTLLRDFDVCMRDEAAQYVSEIADRDSWTNVARRYSEIYRGILR